MNSISILFSVIMGWICVDSAGNNAGQYQVNAIAEQGKENEQGDPCPCKV